MPAPPLVTVLIPTYNRADLLPAAIESVLGQTFRDFELLIVDDGSTDDTAEVVARYDDPRVRLEPNPQNLGSPRTRNRGLDLARGRYVANLDSDDIAEPHRLARQVAYLEAHPNVVLLGAGKRPVRGLASPAQRLRHRPTTPAAIRARMLFRVCISHSTIMARTDVMRRFRYDEGFPVSQDFELFARLAEHHDLVNLPETLVRVRRHAGQASRQRALVAECQKKVLAAQLDRLGVAWSRDDLELHFRLGRPGSWHRPTQDELPRAEAWLRRLADANRATGRYPPDVLARILGEVWLEQWAKAMPGSWLRARRWLWSSPMAGDAWRSLDARLRGAVGLARP